VLALKLYEVMKLGKSFEECMRVVRQCGEEDEAIRRLLPE
jgi:hypothetical protein